MAGQYYPNPTAPFVEMPMPMPISMAQQIPLQQSSTNIYPQPQPSIGPAEPKIGFPNLHESLKTPVELTISAKQNSQQQSFYQNSNSPYPPAVVPNQAGYPPPYPQSQVGQGSQVPFQNPNFSNNSFSQQSFYQIPNQQALPNAGLTANAKASNLTNLVQLSVEAKNLLDRDTFSKSDPVCVLYIKEHQTNDYVEVGRTELIKNNLSPAWHKKFCVDYHFEERQLLKFAIYDWDGASFNLSAHDFLGSLECSLGEVVAAPNKKFERSLTLPPGFSGKSSTIIVVAEELGTNKEVVNLKINGKNLDKKDFFGKSDPFIEIQKQMEDGSWSNVYKSEVIKNTLSPDWKPITLRVPSLTGGNNDRKLNFKVSDWNSSGSSDLIGEFQTTYSGLIAGYNEQNSSFSLIHPSKKAKKKSYNNSGILNITSLKVEEEKSFLDYIQSGVQLHFTVAIDFTASNGDPNHPNSLHFRSPNVDNQYSLAIKAVGEIIQDYDSDKLFPALGFGARIPPNHQVSHEFYLNGNPTNPYCQGVSGILEHYHTTLNSVQLFGPTYFTPIINHAARFAYQHQDGKNYFILLILTDGVISDLESTKNAIIDASILPLSIIIIGVGQEDFSAMEFLDSDGKLLKHNNKTAARDIVQFVELRKFLTLGQSHYYQQNSNYSKVNLARAVLAELPDQLVLWMRKLNPNQNK